jgi:hypothetical protein
MGKVIPLPNGYRGIVGQETVKPMTEGAERNIHVTHTFKSFTYWNWDKPPSLNDALLSALDWVDVSEAVIIDFTTQMFRLYSHMSVRYADTSVLCYLFQLHSATDDNS